MKYDYSLYLVTDRNILRGKDFIPMIEKALAGGVTLVQLREKEADGREFYELAIAIKALTTRFNVPFLINDRLDIALAAESDGVHIGQGDLPLPVVRQLMGPGKIVGYSVSNTEEALYGQEQGADYLGAGPVYSTDTKAVSIPPLGPRGLKEIKEAVSIPVVGIGGIDLKNIQRVKASGVDGIAVVSGILGSDDPEYAASSMREVWDEG